MATKAEKFRYQQERAGPKKAARSWVRHGSRRGGTGLTAHRGPTKKLWEGAAHPLEASAERKYSRVSSRSGASAVKPTAGLREAKRSRALRDRVGTRRRTQ